MERSLLSLKGRRITEISKFGVMIFLRVIFAHWGWDRKCTSWCLGSNDESPESDLLYIGVITRDDDEQSVQEICRHR